MAGAITLKAVAKKAGLSVPTVCLALSGHRRVSKKTQERVRRIAATMGYRTTGESAFAVPGGDKGTRRSYGFVILGVGHSQKAGSGLVQALCHVAANMNRRVEVIVLQDTGDREALKQRLAVHAKELDGLFLTDLVDWDLIDYMDSLKTPCCVLGDVITAPGRYVESLPLSRVAYDVIGMGRVATRSLLEKGLGPVAFLSYSGPKGLYQDRWLTGYCTALQDASLRIEDNLIHQTTPQDFDAESVARAFLKLSDPPRGFVLPDPELAMQFLHMLDRLKAPVSMDAVVLGGTRDRAVQCGLDGYALLEPETEVLARSAFVHMELIVNGTIRWPESVMCRFLMHHFPGLATPPQPLPAGPAPAT